MAAGGAGRLERMIGVIRILERDRTIAKAVVFDMLGVTSESSFKRIKGQLKALGLPLTYDRERGSYDVPPHASIARYGIDPRTRAQLAQVRASVDALGGVARDALQDVLDVLDARIALGDPDAVAVVSSRFPQPVGGAAFYEALDRARSAVRERRWLSFRYAPTTGGEPTARTIAPYAVHVHDGRYYVWGTLEGDAAPFATPRLFALDRASDVRIEDDAYRVDPSLDLADALRTSFGVMVSSDAPHDVVVRFAPAVGAFVACRRWPAETAREPLPDGGVRLTFSVTKSDELIAWVLGFGGEATIVEPAEARAELRRRAEAIVAVSID